MTCKEKFIADHHNYSSEDFDRLFNERCPVEFYDVKPLKGRGGHFDCDGHNCIKCWNQEIPGTSVNKTSNNSHNVQIKKEK